MVFGLSSSESCDSPAIICHRGQFITTSEIAKVRINLEARKPGKELGKQEYRKRSDGFLGFLVASFRSVPFFLFS
jgi:hypothetical protein